MQSCFSSPIGSLWTPLKKSFSVSVFSWRSLFQPCRLQSHFLRVTCSSALWGLPFGKWKPGVPARKLICQCTGLLIWGQCGAHSAYSAVYSIVMQARTGDVHQNSGQSTKKYPQSTWKYLKVPKSTSKYIIVQHSDASSRVMRVRSLADLFSRSCSFQSIYSRDWAAVPAIGVNLQPRVCIHIHPHHPLCLIRTYNTISIRIQKTMKYKKMPILYWPSWHTLKTCNEE